MADHQILIVGGGAAGIATAASLHKRDTSLKITIVEPSMTHYYQPGWTMVGAGIFKKEETARSTASVMPAYVTHIAGAVASFQPEENVVTLAYSGVSAHPFRQHAPTCSGAFAHL